MTIKRYGPSAMPREDGIFVLHSEYEKVVAERDALRAALNDAVREVTRMAAAQSSQQRHLVIRECIDAVTDVAHPEYSLGWNGAVEESADRLRAMIDKETA